MKKFTLAFFIWVFILISQITYISADSPQITEFASLFYIPAIAVPVGNPAGYANEQLKEISATAYTNTGDSMDLSVKWDFSEVDFGRTGAYKITGHPIIPDGITLSENCTLPEYTTSVSVQNYDSPDINAYSCMKAAGILVFPWLPVSDEDQIHIFLKRENSSWVDLNEAGYTFCDTDALYLANSAMLPGNNYSLALDYKSQPTKLLRFYYGSDRTIQLLEYVTGNIDNIFRPSTVIKSIEPADARTLNRYMAIAVSCNDTLDKIYQELNNNSSGLLGSTANTYEDTAENPAHHLNLNWDYSNIELNTPGVYKITGTLSAPEGYSLDPELELPQYTVYVSVQNPLQPEINTYYMPARDFFCFPMCLDLFSDADDLNVWYQKDGSSYIELPEYAGYIYGNNFILERSFLQEGSTYSLYISWKNGQTGIYSFEYDHSFITNDQWMERNYADRDHQTVPDFTQTETTYPSVSPTEKADDDIDEIQEVKESVTDKWTVISGRRLNILMQNSGEEISFEKNGISTVLPVSLIKTWNIGENDTLQIFTQQDGENLSVHIYKGDQEIHEIPGAYIQLPSNGTSSSAEIISVSDSMGEELPVSEDSSQDAITVTTDKTGDFTVNQPQKQSTDRSGMVFILLIIGIGSIVRISSPRKRGV